MTRRSFGRLLRATKHLSSIFSIRPSQIFKKYSEIPQSAFCLNGLPNLKRSTMQKSGLSLRKGASATQKRALRIARESGSPRSWKRFCEEARMALREVRAASLRRDMNEPVRYEALCADLAKRYAQQRSSGASTKSFEGWLRDRMSAREKVRTAKRVEPEKTSKWRLPAQVPAWSYQNSGREHEVAYFAKRASPPATKAPA